MNTQNLLGPPSAALLMTNPLAGWAWAKSIFQQENVSSSERKTAIECLKLFDPQWPSDYFRILHNLRIQCLASSSQEEGQEVLLYLQQQWEREARLDLKSSYLGMNGWVKAFSELKDYGVSEALSSFASESALRNPMMKQYLDSLSLDRIDELFSYSCKDRSYASDLWQVELASRLTPEQSLLKMKDIFCSHLLSNSPSISYASIACVQKLSERVFTSPDLSSDLLEQLFFHFNPRSPSFKFDSLEGLFLALIDQPKPWEGSRKNKKFLKGSTAHLCLAMQLLCDQRYSSALKAFEWVSLLGAGGRRPSSLRTNGHIHLHLKYSIPLIESRYSLGKISVQTPQDVAMLYQDESLSLKLSQLGWTLPKEKYMVSFVKHLDSFVALSLKHSAPTMFSPHYPVQRLEDAHASLISFWESMLLKQQHLTNSPPPRSKSRL